MGVVDLGLPLVVIELQKGGRLVGVQPAVGVADGQVQEGGRVVRVQPAVGGRVS